MVHFNESNRHIYVSTYCSNYLLNMKNRYVKISYILRKWQNIISQGLSRYLVTSKNKRIKYFNNYIGFLIIKIQCLNSYYGKLFLMLSLEIFSIIRQNWEITYVFQLDRIGTFCMLLYNLFQMDSHLPSQLFTQYLEARKSVAFDLWTFLFLSDYPILVNTKE